MAPLPFDNTGIGFIDYAGNSGEHTMLFRVFNTLPRPAIEAVAGALGNLMADLLTVDATVLGIRTQLAGTNFSLPGPFTPVTGTGGTALPEANAPRFISLVGRSTGGRRVRYYVYNTAFDVGPDYRIDTISVESELLAFFNFLNDNENICAIDNLPTTLEAYANVGYNSYFQRKQRVIG